MALWKITFPRASGLYLPLVARYKSLMICAGDDLVIQKVQAWVRDFVSVNNPKLGHFPPCPFAQNAIIQKKTLWFVNSSYDQNLTKSLVQKATEAVEEGAEIGIVIHTHFASWSLSDLDSYVEEWRIRHESQNVYLMRDHPLDEEWVGDVCMNQGDYLLFFVQSKSRLLSARTELEKAGYYRRWTTQEVKNVGHDLGIGVVP